MWRDIREAVRALITQPGLTIIVVLTLALAIGVNTTIFSALYGVVLRPLDYRDPDRLVVLFERNRELGLEQEMVSAATYLDWRERNTTFDGIAAYRYRGFTLQQADGPVHLTSVEVSPVVFDVLGARALVGRTFSLDAERAGNGRQVLLSYGAWNRRFAADPNLVGQGILLDGEPYVVVGVMPKSFVFPAGDHDVEIWSPLTMSLDDLPSRPHRMYSAIGKLAPGVTIERAREDMGAVAEGIARENPESNEGWDVALMAAQEQLVGYLRPLLFFLFGAVALVLLVGCINIASLLLARSTRSAKEYAVRAAFGAGHAALVRRSLVESLVLAGLGGVTGLLTAYAGVAVLRRVMPPSIPRLTEVGIDTATLLFTAGVALVSGVGFGLVPALRVMRPRLTEVLQESTRDTALSRRARWVMDGLVGAEVALALVLLTAATLFVRSFQRLANVDPGFRSENVTVMSLALPPSRYGRGDTQRQFFTTLIDRVQQLPRMKSVGAVSALPMSEVGIDFEIPFSVDGLDVSSPSERPRAAYRAVIPGYFEALGIPVVSGRLLDRIDGTGDRKVALINESLRQRYFGNRNPIGRLLRQMPMLGDLEVVGVVGDVRHSGLSADVQPEVFVPFTQLPLSQMNVILHSDEPSNVVAQAVRAEIRALDPELPVIATNTMDQIVAASVGQPRFNMVLLAGLASCAALLAAIGVYGIVSYSVARRTGEIGIRMALGAAHHHTIGLIVWQVIRILAVSVLVGSALALALSRFIEAWLFGIAATDPATYVLVAVAVLLVGIIAATLPAIRATRVDPVIALRQQ